MCKNELILDLEDKTKPNTTEFTFFYYNGYHLRKHQKRKAKDTMKKQFKKKKSNNFFGRLGLTV